MSAASDCNNLTFESLALKSSFLISTLSSENLHQVRTSRSSGQGRGHSSKKRVCVYVSCSRVICLLLQGDHVTTAYETCKIQLDAYLQIQLLLIS